MKNKILAIGRREFLKDSFRWTVATGIGLSSLHTISKEVSAQKKSKAVFGYLQLSWDAVDLIYAEDLLGKRGWEATYIPVPGSPINLINSFAAGKVDACNMSIHLVGRMVEGGTPLKIVGVVTTLNGSIVVPADSPLRSIDDLKGKKFAVIPSSSTYFDFKQFLNMAYGMDIDKDTKLVTAMSPPDLVTLISKGDVDAILTWPPIADQLLFTGKFRYLLRHVELWEKATGKKGILPVFVLFVVRPDFLRKYPGFADDLNDAYKEAVRIWEKDKRRAVKALVAGKQLKEEVLAFAYDHSVPMMSGLNDKLIETILYQFKLAKDSGFLTKGIWDDPAALRREIFWRG